MKREREREREKERAHANPLRSLAAEKQIAQTSDESGSKKPPLVPEPCDAKPRRRVLAG